MRGLGIGDGAHLEGRFLRGDQPRRRWQVAGGVRGATTNGRSRCRGRTDRGETLAQKAIAAGIPGVQVDGNDVIAVRDCMETALARARAGDGPTLVEALTYRLSDHTTADDASRYRDRGGRASAGNDR